MRRTDLPALDYPRVVLGALAIVTVLALVVAASTSSAAFGAYNPAWDGASDLRAVAAEADIEANLVRNVTEYEEVPATGTVAVVLSPERRYGPAAAARIRDFVAAGGTLLVAEDFGPHTNPFLASLGVRTRVDGRLLRDERHHYRSPAIPIARTVTAHPLTEGVDRLTLNRGTALRPNGSTVLIRTSPYAYLDTDGDEALGETETMQRYPVMTVEPIGGGRVIVLGDPSALINVMLDRAANRALVRTVFAAHDRVLLDYSHATGLPPLAVAVLILRDEPGLQLLVGVVGIAIVGGVGYRPRGTRRQAREDRAGGEEDLDASTLAAVLHRRHPEWDADRVRRVVRGVFSARAEDTDDGRSG